MTLKNDFAQALAPHFLVGEFALWVPARRFTADHQLETAQHLAWFLEQIRERFDGRPVVITSGYRPPAINRQVGGASRSEHLYAVPHEGAVDVVVPGVDIWAVQAWVDQHWRFSLGLGAPRGFVHIGRRASGDRLRWPY
jgi:uncharacterized protein YcbK (DUF882 family)